MHVPNFYFTLETVQPTADLGMCSLCQHNFGPARHLADDARSGRLSTSTLSLTTASFGTNCTFRPPLSAI